MRRNPDRALIPPEEEAAREATSSKDPLAPQRSGREAEEAAASYFEARGFVVVARNVRVGRLEIDLVLREGPVIVIVEVRRRGKGAWVKALASVDAEKRKRIRRAGERLWQRIYKKDASVERMRFDVLAVAFDEAGAVSFEHVTAAF